MVAIHILVYFRCLHLQRIQPGGAVFPHTFSKISSYPPTVLELAKQLIGGFCGRKKYTGKKRKAAPFDNALSLPNLPGHHEVKLEGRKGACMSCSCHGRRSPSGRTPETVYGCDRCGVHLCHSGCFLEYHTENSCVKTSIVILL